MRERSPIITLFSVGKSGHERKDEDILERTSFGRVVSESLPTTNFSNLSTPFSSRWVSFWKDPLLNTIDPVLGTSADQERKELLP